MWSGKARRKVRAAKDEESEGAECYGFATILEEKIGQKSTSQFIGTYKNVIS